MKITISGLPGSGKSSTANILSKNLNLKRYSVGDFRREMARQRNLTLHQLNELGEKNEFTDKDADNWQKGLSKQDNFIIDGRLSYYFIPNSIKLFLTVSPEIGAERIMKENRAEENFTTLKKSVEFWKKRIESDKKRYKKYYNLNPFDTSNYDFVLDTSYMTKEEVIQKILEFLKK